MVVVPNEQFKWVNKGPNAAEWTKPGHDWQAFFCRTCGSPLPGPNDPERTFVPAGLLATEAEPAAVSDHIWVDSRAAWDEIGESGVRHPEHYGSGDEP